MAKIGDTVRFLNSIGGGVVVRIDGALAYVADEDGFETPVLLKECVTVTAGPQNRGFYESAALAARKDADAPRAPKRAEEPPRRPSPTPISEILDMANDDDEPFVETPEGENINLLLAYAAEDIKRISQTSYEAYLVNDSNFYIYYSYLTRGNEQKGWTTRRAGLIEPGTQLLLCKVQREDLPQMDRIAVQYFPLKPDREFTLHPAACVEHRLDTTKFYKLHCFQANPYFDEPVIALPIVRAGIPFRPLEIDADSLAQAMQQKDDSEKPKKGEKMSKPNQQPDEPLVVDLHIHELVDTTAGMSNADMLALQLDTFRRVMDANLRHPGRKIIFIHGKGEGVLRHALMKELSHKYQGHEVQDASFCEYGFGATQVTIRPRKA